MPKAQIHTAIQDGKYAAISQSATGTTESMTSIGLYSLARYRSTSFSSRLYIGFTR